MLNPYLINHEHCRYCDKLFPIHLMHKGYYQKLYTCNRCEYYKIHKGVFNKETKKWTGVIH